ILMTRCMIVCVYFFFFQAEDGIRDRNVTGVQTCALPISTNPKTGGLVGLPHFPPKARRVIFLHQSGAPSQMELFDYKPNLVNLRSEERRVGKECRSRWGGYHEKKKEKKKRIVIDKSRKY